MSVAMHTYAVSLYYCRASIYVYHQAWQSVTLAVYQTEYIVVRRIDHSHALPYVKSEGKTLAIKVGINLDIVKGEHPHSDTPHLPMPYGHKLSRGCQDLPNFTLFGHLRHGLYGSRENPGVLAFQTLFLTFFKIDFVVFAHFVL